MPYEIRKNGNEYCVHNTDTNDNKGCSPTRAQASAHMRALYAAEKGGSYSSAEEAISNLKLALELQAGLIDGSIVLSEESEEELSVYLEEALAALEEYENLSETEITPDQFDDLGHIELSDHIEFSESDEFATEDMTEYPWEGPIVFENVSTGDNRIFKTNSIVWEPETLPWAFRWQKASGQGHAGSVPVGRVDALQRREDGSIHGYGVVIPGLSDEATEYMKLLDTGVGGGVSVDGDSAQFDVLENDEGQPRVEFSSMRLRALSAVDIPAFNGARIHLIKPNKYPVIVKAPEGQPAQAPAANVMGISTPSSSTANGTINISYEIVEPVEEETLATELLHSLEEIQDAITDIGDGIVEVPLEDGNYFRKKEHEGWKISNSLVASAIPVLPTIEAFVDPEFVGPTPLTVTKDGRVFGHLALFNTCHIGFPGTCVKPPKGSKYQYFHTGQIETAEGDLVDVGHLAFNMGHADMNANARQAADHYKTALYDNVRSVAADVRAGEDQFGIWVVGALRSNLTDEDIRAFRSAPLSGDWRRIAGKLELVGALAVNVPGFPVPRAKALVASGETETLFTFLEDDNEDFISDYEMKLRINKKIALGNKVGITKVEVLTDVVDDLILEGADPITDYELQLRVNKKLALAQRLSDPESEFAQSLDDFLSEKDGEVPSADNLPDDLPELPKTPTKADITKIAKNYTPSELLHDLQDLRALLDDPNEKIKATDRKNLEALYALFVSTDKNGTKFTAAGENLEEFYNHNHGKDGKFAPAGGGGGGGGSGSGGGSGKGVTGYHRHPTIPVGKPGHNDPAHISSEHNKSTTGGPHTGKPRTGKPGTGGDRSSGDREQAVKQLSNYRTSKISARRWATTAALATAAQLAIAGGLPLIKLVGPISPLLASPAVLAGLGGLGIFHAGKQLLAARGHKRDFSSTIDRINKRQKIDEQIRRLNSTKP